MRVFCNFGKLRSPADAAGLGGNAECPQIPPRERRNCKAEEFGKCGFAGFVAQIVLGVKGGEGLGFAEFSLPEVGGWVGGECY